MKMLLMAVQKSGMNLLRLLSELVLLQNGWNYVWIFKMVDLQIPGGNGYLLFQSTGLRRNVLSTIMQLYTKVGQLVDILPF